jgi:hypothetical protein
LPCPAIPVLLWAIRRAIDAEKGPQQGPRSVRRQADAPASFSRRPAAADFGCPLSSIVHVWRFMRIVHDFSLLVLADSIRRVILDRV